MKVFVNSTTAIPTSFPVICFLEIFWQKKIRPLFPSTAKSTAKAFKTLSFFRPSFEWKEIKRPE